MLLIGLAIMSVTNVGIALSHSPSPVIAWRALCSIGAALAFPATLSSLTAAFADQGRTKAVAFWSITASFGAFALAGLFGAGALMQFWSWRSNCWTSAGLGVVLLCAVAALVPESVAGEQVTVDWPGSLWAVLGVGLLTFGIVTAGEDGLGAVRVVGALSAGLAMCVVFVRRQLGLARPMLNVRALFDLQVGMGLLGITAVFYGAYATVFVGVQYLSLTHGLTPLQIGEMMLTYGILLIPLTFVSGRMAARLGAGPMGVAGLMVIVAADLLFARMDLDSSLLGYAVAAPAAGA